MLLVRIKAPGGWGDGVVLLLVATCTRRDLRHGLAARLLPVAACAQCQSSSASAAKVFNSSVFISSLAGWVAVWICLSFSMETWV